MLGIAGEIGAFAGELTDRRKQALMKKGFMLCDGRDLAVDQHRELFLTIGRKFTHPGETLEGRFRIPDLRGRVPFGADAGFMTTGQPLGTYLGDEAVVLTEAQLPPHNHANGAFNQLLMLDSAWTLEESDYTANEPGLIRSRPLATVGQGLAHSNMQPSLAVHYFVRFRGARTLEDLLFTGEEDADFLQ